MASLLFGAVRQRWRWTYPSIVLRAARTIWPRKGWKLVLASLSVPCRSRSARNARNAACAQSRRPQKPKHMQIGSSLPSFKLDDPSVPDPRPWTYTGGDRQEQGSWGYRVTTAKPEDISPDDRSFSRGEHNYGVFCMGHRALSLLLIQITPAMFAEATPRNCGQSHRRGLQMRGGLGAASAADRDSARGPDSSSPTLYCCVPKACSGRPNPGQDEVGICMAGGFPPPPP